MKTTSIVSLIASLLIAPACFATIEAYDIQVISRNADNDGGQAVWLRPGTTINKFWLTDPVTQLAYVSGAGLGLTFISNVPTVDFSIVATLTDVSNAVAAANPSFSFNNSPGRSIVTTINAANGFQPSATRNTSCSYSITISATATGLIGGASSGYVVYEICSTNSATGSNWTEIGRWTNGQSINSLLTLSSTQPIGSDVMKIVPAGWYVRLRSVNVSGSPSYTVNSGQEVAL
jgi:hypothetical protein